MFLMAVCMTSLPLASPLSTAWIAALSRSSRRSHAKRSARPPSCQLALVEASSSRGSSASGASSGGGRNARESVSLPGPKRDSRDASRGSSGIASSGDRAARACGDEDCGD